MIKWLFLYLLSNLFKNVPGMSVFPKISCFERFIALAPKCADPRVDGRRHGKTDYAKCAKDD